MNFIKISILFLLIGTRALTYSQETDKTDVLFVTPFGVDHGLRQSMVRGVIQDSTGLMWMTTGDGLHCFDGREFISFRVPVNGVYNHSDNLMGDMMEESPGVLTISSTSSVLKFNTTTGKYSIIYRKDGCYPVLLNGFTGHETFVWSKELKLCLVTDDGLSPRGLNFESKNGLPEGFFPKQSIGYKSKELLISDDNRLFTLAQGKGTEYKAKWVAVRNCQSIAADNNGRVFILADGKIYLYQGQGVMKPFFETRLTGAMSLFIDSKNNFWLTSRTNNKQYRISGGILYNLKLCFHDGKHIDSITPVIKTVFEDNHHNLWFGTDGDGVLLYSPAHVHFLRSDIGFTRCIAWYNDEIWAGTYNDGLWKISPELARAKRVLPAGDPNGVYYVDLLSDRKGRLWVVTRQGLEVIDATGHTLFRDVFNCQNAKLMIQSGDTVILFRDDLLSRYFAGKKPGALGSMLFGNVTTVLSNGDTYWIGTRYGLFQCSKAAGYGKYATFNKQNRRSTNPVYSLLLQEGQIWASTGNGIEIFDRQGKRLALPAFLKEISNEMIYSLLSDDLGQVWFTGNHGIGCINTKTQRIIYFNAQNNLQSLEFNSNAACRAPNGKLYFGGIHGINGFDPSWFNPGKKAQKVRLFSLLLSDTAYSGGIPAGSIVAKLGRRAPHVSGKVFCPDYTNAGSQLFSFFLEGYQQDWSKPSPNAEFNYRDLPPGNYRLLAKCADSWQNWSDPELLFSVTLNPPFWKTGWFLVIIIIVIAGATAMVVRRINSIRYLKQILALEQQNAVEKERLRISKDMHDDLGASLTRISILSELAKKQNDDPVKSRQIIEQISDISGGVVDDMSEIIWAMNPRNDSLDSFSSYIRQYASAYLESAGIEGRFAFPGQVPVRPMSSEFRRDLFLTVKEALHNIVKHAGATNVNMILAFEGHLLRITLTDNGRGFSEERNTGWGNGLVNMRKRIEEHEGIFQIRSQEGKGTTVEISINLPLNEKSH